MTSFGQRLFDATGGGGSVQLLTDGREIYARTASGAFFNLLKAPTQPLLVIGERRTAEGVERESQGPKEKTFRRVGTSICHEGTKTQRTNLTCAFVSSWRFGL